MSFSRSHNVSTNAAHIGRENDAIAKLSADINGLVTYLNELETAYGAKRVPLPLNLWREVDSNADVGKVTGGGTKSASINLYGCQEADGTALAAFADGASPTPGFHDSVTNEIGGIRWNNHANPDPIAFQWTVPEDCDVTANIVVHFLAAKVGATLGDAVTWTMTAFNQVDGALYDADANFGGASSAMTGDAATKTVQDETLTLALADLPAAGNVISFTVQPTDGTLGTDDVILCGILIDYTSTESIAVGSAPGGLLGSDTTPALVSANSGTDEAQSIQWAASNSDPIAIEAILPEDFDGSSAVTVHIRAKMSGATDTPTIGVSSSWDEGDTAIADTSSALGATFADETATIAAADVPDTADTVTLVLTPGAHTTDTLIITAIWLTVALSVTHA